MNDENGQRHNDKQKRAKVTSKTLSFTARSPYEDSKKNGSRSHSLCFGEKFLIIFSTAVCMVNGRVRVIEIGMESLLYNNTAKLKKNRYIFVFFPLLAGV